MSRSCTRPLLNQPPVSLTLAFILKQWAEPLVPTEATFTPKPKQRFYGETVETAERACTAQHRDLFFIILIEVPLSTNLRNPTPSIPENRGE